MSLTATPWSMPFTWRCRQLSSSIRSPTVWPVCRVSRLGPYRSRIWTHRSARLRHVTRTFTDFCDATRTAVITTTKIYFTTSTYIYLFDWLFTQYSRMWEENGQCLTQTHDLLQAVAGPSQERPHQKVSWAGFELRETACMRDSCVILMC